MKLDHEFYHVSYTQLEGVFNPRSLVVLGERRDRTLNWWCLCNADLMTLMDFTEFLQNSLN